VLFLVIVWFVSRGLPGMWDDVRGILVGR